MTACPTSSRLSLRKHGRKERLAEGDLALIAESALRKDSQKQVFFQTHGKHKSRIMAGLFCGQGQSVWRNDCWTDKADKIEVLVFLSTSGREQIWWLLVYKGAINNTVISYDRAKLHTAPEAAEWKKRAFLDWWNTLTSPLLWCGERLAVLIAVNKSLLLCVQ